MTGYTVHTGTSKKFVNGWDRVFEEKPQADEKATTSKAKKSKKVKKKKKS
jgi:hypothetical protein